MRKEFCIEILTVKASCRVFSKMSVRVSFLNVTGFVDFAITKNYIFPIRMASCEDKSFLKLIIRKTLLVLRNRAKFII